MLGFKTRKQRKAEGQSWYPFGIDCIGGQSFAKYTFWTRLRLAVLIIFNKDISNLHIPFEGSTIKDVDKWVKENRTPAVMDALKRASELRGEENEQENK
jgi:hypothetical protein